MHRILALLVPLFLTLAACGNDTSGDEDAATGTTSESSAEPATDTTEATETTEMTETEGSEGESDSEELYPDVVGVEAVHDGDGSWTFNVTLSSPYDSAERYADAWRVVGPDGSVYGERILLHDHASEQPFTRSQSGIEIPDDVTTVTIEGRDQISGWGGATMDVALER